MATIVHNDNGPYGKIAATDSSQLISEDLEKSNIVSERSNYNIHSMAGQ